MWERDVVEHLAEELGVKPNFVEPTVRDPFGWSEQPLSVAGDGGRWLREAGGIRPRPVRPLLSAVVRAQLGG